jgi:hypothetical protein
MMRIYCFRRLGRATLATSSMKQDETLRRDLAALIDAFDLRLTFVAKALKINYTAFQGWLRAGKATRKRKKDAKPRHWKPLNTDEVERLHRFFARGEQLCAIGRQHTTWAPGERPSAEDASANSKDVGRSH